MALWISIIMCVMWLPADLCAFLLAGADAAGQHDAALQQQGGCAAPWSKPVSPGDVFVDAAQRVHSLWGQAHGWLPGEGQLKGLVSG